MVQRSQNGIGRSSGPAIIHAVRYIIKMEKVVHEITADTQLGVVRVRVAHRGELASFQSMKLSPCFRPKVALTYEPCLRSDHRSLDIGVDPQIEGAVRYQIRNDND